MNRLDQIDNNEAVENEDQPKDQNKDLNELGYTPSDADNELLLSGKETVKSLGAKKRKIIEEGKTELDRILKETKDLSPKEYNDYKDQLKEEEDLGRLEKKLKEIKDIPKRKEEERKKDAESAKELDPNDRELLKLQSKFDQICRENAKYIGTKQVPEFTQWFEEERNNTPTVKHLNNLIDRLKGNIQDKNGLGPRKEEYDKLSTLFSKNGLDSPLDSAWIKREGLSERQEFRKNAEDLEEHFRKLEDTGFYSKDMIKKSMKEILLQETPLKQREMLQKATNIARKEAEGFVHLSETMTIEGVTIKKMSDASKKKYLDYYKGTEFKERGEMVSDWKKLVENEAKLAKKLEKLYRDADDKEGLKTALKSFGELDFLSKEKAIPEHKDLIKNNADKNERQKTLLKKACETAIKKAGDDNTLSKKTVARYIEFFNKEENYKNPQTGKPGDTEQLKKFYEKLTSNTVDNDARNIAAYRKQREEYSKDLKRLHMIDSSVDEQEMAKCQADFDGEGWTKRAKFHENLKAEIKKQERERLKRKELENEAGLTAKEKTEARESSLELKEAIKAAEELMNNNQGAEAMKVLLEYNETDPDNPKILFWIETVARFIKEFGSGKKAEDKVEQEIDSEIDQELESDEMEDLIEEEQIKRLNIEGAEMSEERHGKKIKGRDRAEKEALSKVEDGSIEEDIIKNFHESENEYFINEEGTGEKIEEIEFKDEKMSEQDRINLSYKTFDEQRKLYSKEGFTHIDLKDKSGRKISAEEAERKQEKDMEKLEDELAEKALENRARKKGNVFSLNDKIAAKRKAKEELDSRTSEKIAS